MSRQSSFHGPTYNCTCCLSHCHMAYYRGTRDFKPIELPVTAASAVTSGERGAQGYCFMVCYYGSGSGSGERGAQGFCYTVVPGSGERKDIVSWSQYDRDLDRQHGRRLRPQRRRAGRCLVGCLVGRCHFPFAIAFSCMNHYIISEAYLVTEQKEK